MTPSPTDHRRPPRSYLAGLCCLVALAGGARAEPAAPDPGAPPPVLTLEAAVHFALENNPALAAQRQQRGIAAARVVIADTYPFNPVLENRFQGAEGPKSAGITNRLPLEHILVWEVELFHQRRYRREGADAALSRTDWEVAYQEQTLAVQVIRAYATLLYRQEKLRLIEETVAFNQQLVKDVQRLIDIGKLKTFDLIVAQTEVTDTLDLVGAGREALTTARQDLYRVLGVVDGAFVTQGQLEAPPLTWDPAALVELALTRRADLQARRQGVTEAAANLRLTVANRWGNPALGPAYTYDPTGVNFIGLQLNVPLPLANTHRGEILESEATQGQAMLLLRQTEVNVRQDVAAALAHLDVAERRADIFRTQALPQMRRAVEDMEKLFQAGEPGLDLLRVIDVRRKLLRARDSYLDALWAVRLTRADLLAAIGEPVLGLCAPPPELTHP
jgi:cobalt-zinc-cadmium efflux system outer membrane protein